MSDRLPRVIFWDNLPSPYGVEQYNLLADRGHLECSVWFSARTQPDRSWTVNESDWRFPGMYIDDPSRGPREAMEFAKRCHQFRPDLMVSPYGERAYVAGHVIAKALGVRTVLLVQRTFEAWVKRAWWKEAAKFMLFRSAEAAQVPGPDGAQYAQRYGFTPDRIQAIPLTTNIERFSRRLSIDERREQRARLGIEGCVFLYVGRLWKPKGVLVLLEAFRQARVSNGDIWLLLVGDGLDEDEIRATAAGIGGITFHPFVQASDLYAYYAAADVFVFPTLGDPHGQVIEEAHAAGLPIITSDAAGDIHRRVVDGVSGLVVKAADSNALAHCMVELAADAPRRASMGARGVERVAAWGHETYAAEIERAVNQWLAAPRRATLTARSVSAAGQIAVHTAGFAARSFQREFV